MLLKPGETPESPAKVQTNAGACAYLCALDRQPASVGPTAESRRRGDRSTRILGLLAEPFSLKDGLILDGGAFALSGEGCLPCLCKPRDKGEPRKEAFSEPVPVRAKFASRCPAGYCQPGVRWNPPGVRRQTVKQQKSLTKTSRCTADLGSLVWPLAVQSLTRLGRGVQFGFLTPSTTLRREGGLGHNGGPAGLNVPSDWTAGCGWTREPGA